MMNAPYPPRSPEGRVMPDGTGVTAVLGPTNTGKTFYAIERMIAHSSGVIGLPLRLLAREVYGRLVERVGVGAVALITGEEKIKPKSARYQVCTVEAMPREPNAAFVAIDEVQLCGDLERGHIFTDRVLHARGREETLLLGAGTMRGVLERLLPGIRFVQRPRLSNLVYAGSKKITRLPRRSAIVAFSAEEVYAIAELIRRQRGGAAVVLGALSPRTRNRQVELYQNGDVEFLVATDAIGMGLNLDVDHVAFAQDWKYDGFQYRRLTASEFGQIAGRAGRHLRDGTFGVTARVDPLEDELVEALESHRFDSLKVLQWRSRALDFSSLDALKASLDRTPPPGELTRALPSVDQRALDILSREESVTTLARGAKAVETLWEACKLPDYRRIAPAQHAEIIASIYADLVRRGHVAEDYMGEQVRRADRVEGDIDALSQRIAEVRTWTYVSHRPGWLADPTHWQEKTKGIEDRLSDALHERLTKRFVDRRTSVLMRRLRENAFMEAEVGNDGKVTVEGHHVGELQGFRFTPDTISDGQDGKAIRAAAQKALAGEYDRRAERFFNAPNGDLALGADGLVRWLGAPVAALGAGEDALRPRSVILADDQLTGPARDKVAARAERYVTYQVSTVLKPLADLGSGEGLEGTAKGIAYRLYENFGLIQRREIAEDVRSLDQEARAALRRLGVRFGAYHIFVPALVKPAPAHLMTLLFATARDARDRPGYGEVPQLLATGRTSARPEEGFDPVFYALAGYRLLGSRAVRVDILERLADLIRPALSWKPGTGKRPDGAFDGRAFIVTPAMMSILGATAQDMDEILKGLGYRSNGMEAGAVESRLAEEDAAAAPASAPAATTDDDIPGDEPAATETATFEADASPMPDADEATGPDAIEEPSADAPSADEAAETPGSDGPSIDPATDETQDTAEPRADDAGGDEPTVAQAPTEEAASAEKPAEETRLIQLWRPSRGDRERGPRRAGGHGRNEGRGENRSASADGAEREGRDGERRGARPGRNGPNRERRDGAGGGAGGGDRRPNRSGDGKGPGGGAGHSGKPRFDDRKPRFDKTASKGPRAEEAPRRSEKPKIADPDSPFAKLAALKEQLKK